MTLTVGERKRGQRSVTTVDGHIPKTTLRETWIVTSDDGSESEEDVFNVAGVPALGDNWTSLSGNTDTTLFAVQKTVVDDPDTKRYWEVEVEFSTELPDRGSGGNASVSGNDPTLWDPDVSWDMEYDDYELATDIAGRDTVNGAGDPVDPPVIARDPIWVYRLSRWELSFPLAVAREYVRTLNTSTVVGFDPGQGFIWSITGEAQRLLGNVLWRVSYVVKFKEKHNDGRFIPWNEYRFNRGERYIPDGGGDPVPFIRTGLDGAREGWLTEAGARAAGNTGLLEFGPYQYKEWGPLNLF